LMVRYIDPNNYIGARIDGTDVALIKVEDGVESSVSSAGYDAAATVTVRVKASGIDYTVWVDGLQKLNSTITSMMSYGTVALAGQSPKLECVPPHLDGIGHPSRVVYIEAVHQDAPYQATSKRCIKMHIPDGIQVGQGRTRLAEPWHPRVVTGRSLRL